MSFLIPGTSLGMYCPRPTANYRTVRIPHMPGQGKRESPSRPENLPDSAIPPKSPPTREVGFGSPTGGGVGELGEGQGRGPQRGGARLVPGWKGRRKGKSDSNNNNNKTPVPPPPEDKGSPAEACWGRLRLGPMVAAREAGGDAPGELTGLPRAARGRPAAPLPGPGEGNRPRPRRPAGPSAPRPRRQGPFHAASPTPPRFPRAGHMPPPPGAGTPGRGGRPSAVAGRLCLPSASAAAAARVPLPPPPGAALLPRGKARSLRGPPSLPPARAGRRRERAGAAAPLLRSLPPPPPTRRQGSGSVLTGGGGGEEAGGLRPHLPAAALRRGPLRGARREGGKEAAGARERGREREREGYRLQ